MLTDKTLISDLEKFYIAQEIANVPEKILKQIADVTKTEIGQYLVSEFVAAKERLNAATSAFGKLPPLRRKIAAEIYGCAKSRASIIRNQHCEQYSGDTKFIFKLGAVADANTATSAGDHYSGRSKQYRKTDAVHSVTISFEFAVLTTAVLSNSYKITESSALDGLTLIHLGKMANAHGFGANRENKLTV